MNRKLKSNKRHRYLTFAIIGVISFMAASNSFAFDDWPHWRGPQRNDISSETGLLKSWPEEGPNKVWTNKTSGLGYAGFAVVGDKLFTLGTEEDQGEFALCLNAETGVEIWRTKFASFDEGRGRSTRMWGDGSRSTPSVDGDRVYAMSASGQLACFNKDDGKLLWKKPMSSFGGKVPSWGYSESPLVDGDLVVCTPGGEQGAILALNKMTGDKVWQCSGATDPAHYSSVLPMEINGSKQYVQLLLSQVVGVNPQNGSLLWSEKFNGSTAVIPSPIDANGDVYVTSGYNAGSMLVSVNGNNSKQVWAEQGMSNHHGGVILVGGHVFGFTKPNRGAFGCQDVKTGEMKWKDDSVKKGAVLHADGLFYHVQEAGGKVLLIDANVEGMKVVSSFVLGPQTKRRARMGRIWVHPVIANGKLYLRDQEFISCYDLKAGE